MNFIDEIYPNIQSNFNNIDYFSDTRNFPTPKNKFVHEINCKVLDQFVDRHFQHF